MTTRWLLSLLVLPMSFGCLGAGDGDEGATDGWSTDGKADGVSPWSTEAGLASRMESTILPYFRSAGREGTFVGVDGVPIHYIELVRANEIGALVISSGRTESYVKYAELAYDLRNVGVSIYLVDHRGQGFSGRMLDDPNKGYVHEAADYVTDFATFMDTVVMRVEHERIYGLAHSMGGMILTNYLEQHPGVFDAVVLSAPMLEINAGWLSEDAAWVAAKAATAVGFGESYAPGAGPYDPSAPNTVSHSSIRYAVNEGLCATSPQIKLGGPTYRWIAKAIEGERIARNEAATMLETPILLLQASDDQIVEPGGQNTFCANAPHCTLKVISGGGHELIQERDNLRIPALDAMAAFFAAH